VIRLPSRFESSRFFILFLSRQFPKNNIETGQGYWRSLAAVPLVVGYMRFQARLGLHVK
jgi:hypothetical protein